MSDFERTLLPVAMRDLEVLRVGDVTPGMRRVTLGGPELAAFTRDGWKLAAFRSPGFDDHVKLFFPAPGETDPVLPIQDDGHLDWPQSSPDGPHPVQTKPFGRPGGRRRRVADAGAVIASRPNWRQ